MRILIPVIDSVNALAAVRHAAAEYPGAELRLLHLRSPLPLALQARLTGRTTVAVHAASARKHLGPACDLLERRHVRYTVGLQATADKACAVLAAVRRDAFDCIVLGTARPKSATRLSEDNVVQTLVDYAPVRLILVSGREVSRLERYAVGAGLAATLGLLMSA